MFRVTYVSVPFCAHFGSREHLYRRHALPQYECPKCNKSFEDTKTLGFHQYAASPCEPKATTVDEEFTVDQERRLRLRSRRTAGSTQ